MKYELLSIDDDHFYCDSQPALKRPSSCPERPMLFYLRDKQSLPGGGDLPARHCSMNALHGKGTGISGGGIASTKSWR